jgi:ribose transport system substrate-binding protein
MAEPDHARVLEAFDRRDALGSAALLALALGACSRQDKSAAPASAGKSYPLGKRIKAAFINVGLANSWPAQGKAATEQWAKWLGIDVTWYDGGLSIDKQRKAVDDMATKQWDFVAIQAFGIDTLVDPVSQMIKRGIPVVQMDTMISEKDPGILTFLEPDHENQGEQVTAILCKAIGGTGNIIMTQGALGHSGTKKIARGFQSAVKQFPGIKVLAEDTADWDVNKTAKLWEDYLVKYPQIDAAFFHSDDMSLAASKVIKNAGRSVKLGSIDAMPEAIEAVKDGRLFVTVRSSTARIHWGALICGALAATGKPVPKYIRVDGPIVTKEIADGVAFMEEHLLL